VIVVARFGLPRSPRQRFFLGSLAVHSLLVAAILAFPVFNKKPSFTDSSLIVELAPAFSPPAPSPRQQAPVVEDAPPPEPVEEVRVEPSEPVITKKPAADKPKAETAPPPVEQPDEDSAAGEGPAGAIGGPSEGHSIAPLAGGDLELAWYRASVTTALYSNWQRPILAGIIEPLEVSISFEINRDGSVANLRVDSSSGVPSLDRSALRSVADASPLPPLPPQLREPRLSAYFVFRLYPEEM
jgi:protein TonB